MPVSAREKPWVRVVATAPVVVGGLLIVAAALKGYELLFGPPPEGGILQARWLQFLLIELEAALGAWLISGYRRRLAGIVAVACFAAFATVNADKILRGERHCGCFGLIHLDVRVALALDIVAGFVLAWSLARTSAGVSRPIPRPLWQPRWDHRAAYGSLALLAVGLMANAWVRAPDELFRAVQLAPPVYDFGKVQGGEELSHEFHLTNAGSSAITIVKVTSTCGCTTVGLPAGRVIDGGQSLAVPVNLHTGATEGIKTGTVTVYYRDAPWGVPAWQSCTVRATVSQDYWVRPTLIDFGEVEYASPQTRTVVLRPNALPDARITRVEGGCPGLSTRLDAATEPGKDSKVELVFDSTAHRTDTPLSTTLRLHTNTSRLPVTEVLVRAIPKPAVMVEPQIIVVGSGESGSVERSVTVRTHLPATLKVTESRGVNTLVKSQNTPGTSHLITVTVPEAGNAMLDALVKITVDVVTGQGDREAYTLSIPVQRFPKSKG
ncbi:MAG: DUF1573 domain-containing protein [Gemmataceae bacterium]